MQSQSQWYLSSQRDPQSNTAEQAYKDALSTFQIGSRDHKKFGKIDQIQSITELEGILTSTKNKYEKRNENKKIKQWLERLSARICFYGRIFDVLVQHHPEYVSLAWGLMKVMFVVSQTSK
jgi:hypothetical protein